ncbi:MAG: hypothetical protein GY846_18140 [Deltaproteobacteria bacterium]|nr:hypothetical protein [Deltaproteobacteria bacterium]
MAEIRSTLDIIMEKAKTLTVTDEDKKNFAEKEVQGRVQGLFQKYLDDILSIQQLKAEMASFDEERLPIAEKELRAACLTAMTVEGDNQPLFEILDQLLGHDIKPVLDLIDEFQEQQKKEHQKRAGVQIKTLEAQGVSGSAVIPNLKANPSWRSYLSDMADQFQEKLTVLAF